MRMDKKNQTEIKYKTLFDSSRDAIMMLAPPIWTFTSGNNAAIKMFGAKDETEFISFEPWKVSPEYQPDGQRSSVKAKKMIKKAMEEGSNFFEWQHKKITGEEFSATVLLSRIKMDDKYSLQATVRDITEQKEIEEKLKKYTLELERFNKLAIGRELKMVELKKEIEELKKRLTHKNNIYGSR